MVSIDRQKLYQKYFQSQNYFYGEDIEAAKKEYEEAVKQFAGKLTENEPSSLVVHLNLQIGDKLVENKQITENGDIGDARSEPPLLASALIQEIKNFDKGCGAYCGKEHFQYVSQNPNRFSLPLFPVSSESDFKRKNSKGDVDFQFKFGMDRVTTNLTALPNFLFKKKTVRYGGQEMMIMSKKLDRTGFPLYGFGISRGSFPVEHVFCAAAEFPDTEVVAEEVHKVKTAWLLTMYAAVVKKSCCLAKNVKEKVKDIVEKARPFLSKMGGQEFATYRDRVKSLQTANNSMNKPSTQRLDFVAKCNDYLQSLLSNADMKKYEKKIQKYIELLESKGCSVQDAIELLLHEPMIDYTSPYLGMNEIHLQYKAVIHSFMTPLLKIEEWLNDGFTSEPPHFQATQAAYVLAWFKELAKCIEEIEFDLKPQDDTEIKNSQINVLIQELCKYLNSDETPYLFVEWVKNDKGVNGHTRAVMTLLLQKRGYIDDHVDYGSIDVSKLLRMSEGFISADYKLDYKTAFDMIRDVAKENRTFKAFAELIGLLVPSSPEDKAFVALICFDIGLEYVHSGLYSKAIPCLELSISYDPFQKNDDTKVKNRKKLAYHLLFVLSKIGNKENVEFYAKMIRMLERRDDLWNIYPYLPSGIDTMIETLTASKILDELKEILLSKMNAKRTVGTGTSPVEKLRELKREVENRIDDLKSSNFLCLVAVNLGLGNSLSDGSDCLNRKTAFEIIQNVRTYPDVFCHVSGYLKGVVKRFNKLNVKCDDILTLVAKCNTDVPEEGLLPTMQHNNEIKVDVLKIDKKLSYLPNITEDTYPVQITDGVIPWRFNPYIDSYCTIHVFYKLHLLSPDDPLLKRMKEQADGEEQPCNDLKQEVLDLWKYHLKQWMDFPVPGFNEPKKKSKEDNKNVFHEHAYLQNQAFQYQYPPVWGEASRPRQYFG